MSNQEPQGVTNTAQARTGEEIQTWLVAYMANLLDTSPEAIDVNMTFERHGLDSVAAVAMLSDMAGWYGQELNWDLVDQKASIATLAAELGTGGTQG